MKKEWKIQDLGRLLKKLAGEIFTGQLLVNHRAEQYFIHILFIFFVFGLMIWISIRIDNTLVAVEQNNQILKELEIEHSSLEFELRSIERRTYIDKRLSEMGSSVKESGNAATVIKTGK